MHSFDSNREYFHYAERKNGLTLPIVGAMISDEPSLRLRYLLLFLLLILIGLINNILALMTFLRERIRYTISGVYLIIYSLCSLILMLSISTNLLAVFFYENYYFRLWLCHGHPYLSSIMVCTSILISVAIAIEEVLNKQFNFDKHRLHRRQAIIVSLVIFLLVSLSHLEKIFNRHLIQHRFGNYYCTYNEPYHQFVSQLFIYIYLIIPCLIHVICLITISSIKVQKTCLEKIFFLQKHLIPSIVFILCLLSNSFYRYFLPNQIHFHVLFLCLFYAPQILTYMIYVYPNNCYVKEFFQMWIYRKLCCCFYDRQRHIQKFEVIDKLWPRRTSLETIKTADNLSDTCFESEFYQKTKS